MQDRREIGINEIWRNNESSREVFFPRFAAGLRGKIENVVVVVVSNDESFFFYNVFQLYSWFTFMYPVFPRVIVIRFLFFFLLRHHPRRRHRPARRSSVLARISLMCGSSAPPSVEWIQKALSGSPSCPCLFRVLLRLRALLSQVVCIFHLHHHSHSLPSHLTHSHRVHLGHGRRNHGAGISQERGEIISVERLSDAGGVGGFRKRRARGRLLGGGRVGDARRRVGQHVVGVQVEFQSKL
jgi:hypothetical protein